MFPSPIYDFFSFVVSTMLTPLERAKRPLELRRRWLRERWTLEQPGDHDIWLHAVSVGEALVAVTFIRALKRRFPAFRVALSTVTDTGQAVARRSGAADTVFYLPWDIGALQDRVLAAMAPRAVVTMETELWPGLIRAAARRKVPFVILNGRISDRSFRGYRRIRWFMRSLLEGIACFGMQTGADLERIRALGAPEDRSSVTGNLKYDIRQPDEGVPSWMRGLETPVLLAGSTHDGEEVEILRGLDDALRRKRSLSLVLAPRHPERFDAVAGELARSGLPHVRRSELTGDITVPRGTVVLLDRMGELAGACGGADFVFVGGSLVPVGGHNILEPAVWGKPVLFGPHMENFREIASDFLAAQAAVRIETGSALARRLERWMASPKEAADVGERSRRLLAANRGAAERSVGILARLVGRGDEAAP